MALSFDNGGIIFSEDDTITEDEEDFNINNFVKTYNPRNVNSLLDFTTADFARDILNYFGNLKAKCKGLLSRVKIADLVLKADNFNFNKILQKAIDVCTKCYKFTISQVKIANSICDDCIKVARDELKKNGKWELDYDDNTTTESTDLGIFESVKFI